MNETIKIICAIPVTLCIYLGLGAIAGMFIVGFLWSTCPSMMKDVDNVANNIMKVSLVFWPILFPLASLRFIINILMDIITWCKNVFDAPMFKYTISKYVESIRLVIKLLFSKFKDK